MDQEDPGTLARRWREALADWEIPDVLAAAPAFIDSGPGRFSTGVAAEALAECRGDRTVLDVGVGAGAASLALRDRVSEIIGMDENTSMLTRFAGAAAAAGVAARTVLGRWPDAAESVPVADVVICAHVLFSAPDIVPFVEALTTHARSRVVVEVCANHPATILNPLWTALHGINRPEGPTAAEAIEIIDGLGLAPRWHAWERPVVVDGTDWNQLVAAMSERLSVGPERAPDVAAALRGLGATPDVPHLGGPTRGVVTIWWDPLPKAPAR